MFWGLEDSKSSVRSRIDLTWDKNPRAREVKNPAESQERDRSQILQLLVPGLLGGCCPQSIELRNRSRYEIQDQLLRAAVHKKTGHFFGGARNRLAAPQD